MPQVSDKIYGEWFIGKIGAKLGIPKTIAINQYESVSPGITEKFGMTAKLLDDVDAINSAIENVTEGMFGPVVPNYQNVFKALEEEHTFWLALTKVPPAIAHDVLAVVEEGKKVVTGFGKQAIPYVIGGVALWIFLPRIVQSMVGGAKKAIMK